MAHLSIAIIRKEGRGKVHEGESKYEYWIQKIQDEQYKFFDHSGLAINGRFDYSKFKRQIIEHFNFPREEDLEGKKIDIDFLEKPSFFKSDRKENATSYVYTLSNAQIQHLSEQESEYDDWFWVDEQKLQELNKNFIQSQQFIFEKENLFKQPKLSNSFRTNLKNIAKAKENGKLVIFAGAGVSVDSGVPNWFDLIEELKSDIDSEETENLKVAEEYFKKRGKKEYMEKIQEVLKHKKTYFNPLHELIVDLNPAHIITTNYDTHFEQVLEEKNVKYSIVKKDKDLPYSQGASLYIKMHGDFDEKNIVLQQNDYEKYDTNFPLIEGFVKGIFASKLVLFVGFSFSDPNLQQILESVNKILQEDNQKPYLLITPDETDNPNKKEEIKNKGINLIEIEKEEVDSYLESEKNGIKEKLELLGLKGENVYKFLKVVQNFDVVSDTIENQEIEDQFINSLDRFQSFGAIPPKIIERIYPFKLKGYSKFEDEGGATFSRRYSFHLESPNEDFLNFLEKRKQKTESKKVEFLTFKDKSLSPKEQSFNRAFKLLYNSGVQCVIRKNDTSPEHYRLNPTNSEIKCQCHKCLIERFEYGELIIKLERETIQSICRTNLHQTELLRAFGYFKTGQYFKAYYMLQEAKVNSWKREDYVTFFLANYNETLLLNFMYGAGRNTADYEKSREIRDEIRNIDLDKVLSELPIDKDVREALKIIKDRKIESQVKSEIKKQFAKFSKTFKGYKRGGFRSMGPNYWLQIQVAFYKLYKFYHLNLLFDAEYDDFQELTHFYIESMVIGHCISVEYQQRMKNFDPFFVNALLNYAQPKKCKEIFEEYKLESISFEDEKHLLDVLNDYQAFCHSGFRENNFLGKSIDENELYDITVKNSRFFEQKIERIFKNFFLLFNYLNLSEKQLNEIIDTTLNYLSQIQSYIFNQHDSLNFFGDFVSKNIEAFTNENVIRVLKFTLSDEIWSDKIIDIVCGAIVNNRKQLRLLGEDELKLVLRRTEARRSRSIKPVDVFPFYALFKKPQQSKFRKFVFEHLDSYENIRIAYYWGIWKPNTNKKIWKRIVEELQKESKDFPNYEISDRGLPENIQSFRVWNKLNFFVMLVYRFDFFGADYVQDIKNKVSSQMFKWLLDPENFDYSKFNIRWLLIFDDAGEILNELKTIPQFMKAMKSGLAKDYQEKIAKLYFQLLD